jgi:hypothetical protein
MRLIEGANGQLQAIGSGNMTHELGRGGRLSHRLVSILKILGFYQDSVDELFS